MPVRGESSCPIPVTHWTETHQAVVSAALVYHERVSASEMICSTNLGVYGRAQLRGIHMASQKRYDNPDAEEALIELKDLIEELRDLLAEEEDAQNADVSDAEGSDAEEA